VLLLRASTSLVPIPFLGWFSKLGIRWPATMNRGPHSSLWVAQSRAPLQRGQRTECPRHRHERLPSRLRWRRYQQRWRRRRRRRRRRWLVRRAALVVIDEIVGAVHGPARQPARNEKRGEHWARDRGDTRARELHRTARHGGEHWLQHRAATRGSGRAQCGGAQFCSPSRRRPRLQRVRWRPRSCQHGTILARLCECECVSECERCVSCADVADAEDAADARARARTVYFLPQP